MSHKGGSSDGNKALVIRQEDPESSPDSSSGGERKAGRRKINIEFIEDKSRRHITFSKRKAGIMKKAYELSILTGTQVLLLVASETGHVYTFATPKLQPLITKAEGKNLIQACLNTMDTPALPSSTSSASTSASAPSSSNTTLSNGNSSASNPTPTQPSQPLLPQIPQTQPLYPGTMGNYIRAPLTSDSDDKGASAAGTYASFSNQRLPYLMGYPSQSQQPYSAAGLPNPNQPGYPQSYYNWAGQNSSLTSNASGSTNPSSNDINLLTNKAPSMMLPGQINPMSHLGSMESLNPINPLGHIGHLNQMNPISQINAPSMNLNNSNLTTQK